MLISRSDGQLGQKTFDKLWLAGGPFLCTGVVSSLSCDWTEANGYLCCVVDGELRGGAHVEEQQDGGSGLYVQTLHTRQQRTEDHVRVYQRLSQGAGQGARHRGGQRGRQERHHLCTGTFIHRHLREQGKALVIEEGSEGTKNAITFVQVRSYNAITWLWVSS